tara:strand:+ start:75 stop:614 length:540 start_codon:yes stop_codon:yes gene_type:complete
MAGQRLTDKTALEQQTGSGDLFMVVDVNDTTGSAAGTSKKIDAKYIIQTDKFSLSNAEVINLSTSGSPKTLVSALSGYMVTPISCTILCTPDPLDLESSNKNLYLGFDHTQNSVFWDYASRFMGSLSSNQTYIFGGNQPGNGVKASSTINTAFYMWSSGAFNGGWSCDVYLTYAYTKVL